jgi:hypothetical protein
VLNGFVYRNRPVEVEAVQLVSGKMDTLPAWLQDAMAKKPGALGAVVRINSVTWAISCGRGKQPITAHDGDYVIRRADGSLTVCKPHIFEQTYEKVL